MYPAAGIAMAEAVETMVGQAAPSVLADEVICPALREYGARPPPADRQAPDPTAAARCIPRQLLTAACRLLTPPVYGRRAGPCMDDAKCAAVMAASSSRLYRRAG